MEILIKTYVQGMVKKMWRGTPRASATCACPITKRVMLKFWGTLILEIEQNCNTNIKICVKVMNTYGLLSGY